MRAAVLLVEAATAVAATAGPHVLLAPSMMVLKPDCSQAACTAVEEPTNAAQRRCRRCQVAGRRRDESGAGALLSFHSAACM